MEGKVGTSVALTVLFGPLGLIKHGKNVEVKAGTALTGFSSLLHGIEWSVAVHVYEFGVQRN